MFSGEPGIQAGASCNLLRQSLPCYSAARNGEDAELDHRSENGPQEVHIISVLAKGCQHKLDVSEIHKGGHHVE